MQAFQGIFGLGAANNPQKTAGAYGPLHFSPSGMYESDWVPAVWGSPIVFRTGLGRSPLDAVFSLLCVVNDANWLRGDIIPDFQHWSNYTTHACSIVHAPYKTTLMIAATFRLLNKTTFATTTLTAASWRVKLKAR